MLDALTSQNPEELHTSQKNARIQNTGLFNSAEVFFFCSDLELGGKKQADSGISTDPLFIDLFSWGQKIASRPFRKQATVAYFNNSHFRPIVPNLIPVDMHGT